jgi:hypothetical protein
VQLQEEVVHVRRVPADRPATERDLLGEGVVEVTETVEEPVVAKQAAAR